MLPPQHGAWAFLGLPIAVAIPVSPWTPLLILLTVTWVCAYPASYFLLAVVRDRSSRRPDPGQYRRPLIAWWVPTLVGGLALLVARPWLLWVALGYGILFAVNVAFARRRDERALANDAVFIAECTAMVPVTWAVAAGGSTLAPPPLDGVPAHVWVLTVAVALVLAGSTLQVKSLIRERGDARFARASRGFAAVSLLAAGVLAVWWGPPPGLLLLVPFAWLAGRAVLVTDPATRPARIGLIELVGFLLLVGAATLATAWTAP